MGARIRLVVETEEGIREIHRAPGSVSSFGGSSIQRQEIGLGRAMRIREMVVWWPASGERTTYRDVPMNRLIEVVEGRRRVRVLPLRPVRFATRAGDPGPR